MLDKLTVVLNLKTRTLSVGKSSSAVLWCFKSIPSAERGMV
jgi:hypothetical protein